MTNSAASYITALLLSAFTLSSCNYRDINNAYFSSCDIMVNVDWSRFDKEEVSGMSIYCYPVDDAGRSSGAPYISLSNTISGHVVSLPAGRYNVLVFNQSVDEFGSFTFSGMDRFETAGIILEEKTAEWTPVTEGQSISVEPEWFAVDRHLGFDVTDKMVRESKEMRDKGSKYGIVADLTLTPKNIVYAASVDVRVHGAQNVLSARGSLTGLSRGFLLGAGCCTDEKTTNLLEAWNLIKEDGDGKKGNLKIGFRTLGLPGSLPEISKSGNGRSPDANLLFLSVLLVDQETICNSTFQVGDLFRYAEDDLRLTLQIGAGSDSPQAPGEGLDPFSPILFPDVKPKDGGGGGFSAEVEDWGDEENVDVPVV